MEKEMSRQAGTKTSTLWENAKANDARPCIWMQAGVTAKKNCNNFYDCTCCKYDSAMEKQAIAGKHLSWQDSMRMRDGNQRTCRHAMTGRADYRTCPMNYNCDRCEFDQYFEETLSAGIGHSNLEMTDVKGFKMPKGYHFHNGHTWASIDSGGIIRIGMDDFAFKVMGGPDGFELPLIGQELNQNIPAWGIKRGTNVADIQSPINGVITKVNHKVATSPELPADTPYRDGWLFTAHNSDIKGILKELMAMEESEKWLNEEVTTLEGMIEKVTGPLATDGGLLQKDVYGNLPGLGWNNLAETFLKA
ncbi:MAG: glycine cleavage system protein H [Bacteroidales bacterium]|nr:glycine cleavage system protein H [Bacteroidales bacterium]